MAKCLGPWHSYWKPRSSPRPLVLVRLFFLSSSFFNVAFFFNIGYIIERDGCPCGPLIKVRRVWYRERWVWQMLQFFFLLDLQERMWGATPCCETTLTPRDGGWSFDDTLIWALTEWSWQAPRLCQLCCSRVQKIFPSSVGWKSAPSCIHRPKNLLQSLARKIVQPVLLSLLWQGCGCPLLAYMSWWSCPPCAFGHAVHWTGVSNWGGPVPIYALQDQTTNTNIFPVARIWVQQTTWRVSQ